VDGCNYAFKPLELLHHVTGRKRPKLCALLIEADVSAGTGITDYFRLAAQAAVGLAK